MKKKLLLLALISVATLLVALLLGSYPLTIKEFVSGLFTGAGDGGVIVRNVRLPRVLCAFLCGGGLAVAGFVLQTVFRNPLASPDILGVSSGCGFGAALGIVFSLGGAITSALAFIGGGVAVIVVMLISKASNGGSKTTNLIISGIVVASFFSAGTMLIKYMADPFTKLPAIEFWLMGGFYAVSVFDLLYAAVVIAVCTTTIYALRYKIKILSLGDTDARSLGVNPGVLRSVVLLVTTVLIAVSVSVAGLVGWVGLLAPHIAKLYFKDDVQYSLPFTFLAGGCLTVLADLAARTVTTGEIPVSIALSFVAGPFLVYLLYKKKAVHYD